MHFTIGLDRGILKTAKFNKTDMQYIREARFFQNQGVDGLLQLAAVYSVDLKLFGNCLLYPGMEIFVNPFSLGGEQFMPQNKDSVANKLGLGGYHLVTRVSSEITAGSFNTDVKALFVYSGDGNLTLYKHGAGLIQKTNLEDREQTEAQKKECSDTYNKQFQKYKDVLETGTFSADITITPSESVEAAPPAPEQNVQTEVIQPAVVASGDSNTVQSLNSQPLGTIPTPEGKIVPYFKSEKKGKTIYYYDINRS